MSSSLLAKLSFLSDLACKLSKTAYQIEGTEESLQQKNPHETASANSGRGGPPHTRTQEKIRAHSANYFPRRFPVYWSAIGRRSTKHGKSISHRLLAFSEQPASSQWCVPGQARLGMSKSMSVHPEEGPLFLFDRGTVGWKWGFCGENKGMLFWGHLTERRLAEKCILNSNDHATIPNITITWKDSLWLKSVYISDKILVV